MTYTTTAKFQDRVEIREGLSLTASIEANEEAVKDGCLSFVREPETGFNAKRASESVLYREGAAVEVWKFGCKFMGVVDQNPGTGKLKVSMRHGKFTGLYWAQITESGLVVFGRAFHFNDSVKKF